MVERITPLRLTPIDPAQSRDQNDLNRIDKTFKNALSSAIDEISGTQAKADQQIQNLATGKTDNIHQAMIALEEASIVLQLTSQVRNKVVEAYQEIMRMQI